MRSAVFTLLVALPLALPAFAGSPVVKGPVPPSQQPPVPAAPPAMTPAQACAKQQENRAKRMDQLASYLKLTAAQKPLFEAWKKSRLDAGATIPCPPLVTNNAVATPERMQNQITMMSATLAAIKQVQKPTADFYNSLTKDQRKMFDAPMRMMMEVTVPPGGPKDGKLTVKPVDPTKAEP
jgi:LTXXQ motif family protein